MWLCHKCSKPVYFAERKQSLGYDWHPECLRCEECGKRLNPGQHAEHKGVPYCHVPCYGALFGPQLFGHGTRVESHKSFGAKTNTPRQPPNGTGLPLDQIESKLKEFNETSDSKGQEIRCREVNGRLVLEGALRVYWGVQGVIHLKEDDDQRTVVTVRKRNSCRYSNSTEFTHSEKSPLLPPSVEVQSNNDGNDTGTEISTASILDGGDTTDISMTESISMDTFNDDVHSITSEFSSKEVSPEHKSITLPSKLQIKDIEWDELDDLLQVERKIDESEKLYQTMPSPLPSQSSSSDPDTSESRTPVQPKVNSSDESQKTDTEFKSAVVSISQEADPSDKKSDEYLTPCNTLKSVDYDEFKQQMRDEFIQNSSQLQHINDGTLKSRQPIDPSRINDSLKLYSEQMMSKSFSGEAAMRLYPTNIQYQTLKNSDSQSLYSNHENYPLKKSDSAAVTNSPSDEDLFTSPERNINRSKSGPNWYRNNNSNDSDDSETLKPSTIKKGHNANPRSINIKMDCYDEISGRNGTNGNSTSSTVTSVSATESSTTNTNNLYHDPLYDDDDEEEVVVLRKKKTGSTAIKRRSGNRRSRAKLKRRCSINGHFYNRETSFFTPPRGSQMSVWVSSLVSTQEVVNLILEKYKVESRPENFALYVVRDSGEQRKLKDEDFPLLVRIILGPHEDVSRIFLMDSHTTTEISCEVAQFINLSVLECKSILDRYEEERLREIQKIKERYAEFRRRIVQRMESLKVRL